MFKSLVNTLLPGNSKPQEKEPYLEIHTTHLNTPLRINYSDKDATQELMSFLNAHLQQSQSNINTSGSSNSSKAKNEIVSGRRNSSQDSDLTITFLTHGYMSHIHKAGEYFPEIKDAILSHGVQPHVVALLDWSSWSGSTVLDYSSSIKNVPKVAAWLGSFVQRIRLDLGERVFVHGIGFSLGAHLMGNCAEWVDKGCSGDDGGLRVGGKAFNRITGLDPAGPGLVFKSGIFSLMQHQTIRLGKDHATLVDIIHTSDHLGTTTPLGHVDFYPNFGTTQRGIPNLGYLNVLSHIFCLKLFLDTILEKDKFRCTKHIRDLEAKTVDHIPDKFATMGYFCEGEARGLFYLDIGKI